MKKAEKHLEHSGNQWPSVLGAWLKGSAAALLFVLAVLFLCSIVTSAGWLGKTQLEHAVPAACVVAAFLGGAVAVHRHRDLSLLLGIGTGLGLFVLLLIIGILLYDQAPVANRIAEVLCACLCGGALIGVFGRRGKKKRRR